MRRALPLPLARVAAVGALAVLLPACSSDGPTTSDGAGGQPLDAGRVLTGVALPPLGAVAGTGMPMAGVPLGALPVAFDATRCVRDAAARRFVCPPVTHAGLTTTLSYVPLDAAGNVQDGVDRGTTAAIRYLSAVEGTVSLPAASGGPAGTLAITERRELTVGGLLGAARTLDGTATASVDGTIALAGLPATPVRVTLVQTIRGLVLPADAASRWPTAGTITTDATTAGIQGGPAFTVRTALTFDGSRTARLTVTGPGLSERCTIDLADPAATPVCTR